MKIIISLDEVKQMVERAVREKGLSVKAGSAAVISHVEGMYDDSREVLDGISFEIEETHGQRR